MVLKDFRLFDISDFSMDEDFVRWVHRKRKVDSDSWDNWLSQNLGKHVTVEEIDLVLKSIRAEQK